MSLTWWSFACYLDACDLRSLNPPPSDVYAIPPSPHSPFARHSSSINHSIQHVFLLSHGPHLLSVDSQVSHTCHHHLSYHYSKMRLFCLPRNLMNFRIFSFSSLSIQAIHGPNVHDYIRALMSPESSTGDSRCSSWCHRRWLGSLTSIGDRQSKRSFGEKKRNFDG